MENRKSLLKLSSVDIPDTKLSIRIPTVGEILEDESTYYNIVSSLTASPFQYMVQLDDMGIDFTKITDYELFKMLFPAYTKSDLSILLGDLDISDFSIYRGKNQEEYIYSSSNNIEINEKVYHDLVNTIRKINAFEKINYRPGNESARKYLLEKERKKQKRNAKKPYEPYLEKLVIALVNTSEFPYNYDSCMDLSIYRFHQSFKQIQHKIAFDKTMIGVYAGTVDTSRLSNKDNLSWIPNK
ncbi:MAG: hypothetical protein HDQ96_12570 [Lachnospiraceae bacterium]|nr:hypothetical protein [Lachnospiraceae bacterium]